MRLILQRTSGVEVWIDGRRHSSSGPGLLILYGTKAGDREESCAALAQKVAFLRIFEDDDGKMNRSILDVRGEAMVVSQFTLYADTRKGRRPSYNEAMPPGPAEKLYEKFVACLKSEGVPVATGVFGAKMDIRLNNDGPVTIILEHDV